MKEGLKFCEHCGKVIYPTRFKAKKQARYLNKGDRVPKWYLKRQIAEYACPRGNGYHIGHQSRHYPEVKRCAS